MGAAASLDENNRDLVVSVSVVVLVLSKAFCETKALGANASIEATHDSISSCWMSLEPNILLDQ